MLVWIVYVPDAARRGPDIERMNRVEDLPDELGRLMIGDGTARKPTDDEAAAYRKAADLATKVDDMPGVPKMAARKASAQIDSAADQNTPAAP